jgi:PTH1 family peptidyl-tRNA hydrolase
VYDELDIPFGQNRTRVGGGSAGHNGMKSVMAHVGDDVNRVRIGIKSAEASRLDSADYVLQKFTAEEEKHLPALIHEVQSILTEYIYSGKLTPETRQVVSF